ncbi:hypothetical protein ACQCX5_11280 [Propionibacteriaceae bacterium G57]|uniref:hypothetical protein n=1 Tax=Aestuariimicrobium sp. G57 TaxID=3418485 RepID=UPI003DA716F3
MSTLINPASHTRRVLLSSMVALGALALVGCSRDQLVDAHLNSVHPVPGQQNRLVVAYVSAAQVRLPIEVELQQDPQQVRIRVRERRPTTDMTAIAYEHTTEVTLDAPLGSRPVIDLVTGLSVKVVT